MVRPSWQSFCSSDIGTGPLYVSPVFETGLNVKARVATDFSRQGDGRNVDYVGKLDHGYCLSTGLGGPQYLSSLFPAGVAANLSLWLNGVDKFLRARYGYTGNGVDVRVVNPVDCNNGWKGGLERMIKARRRPLLHRPSFGEPPPTRAPRSWRCARTTG